MKVKTIAWNALKIILILLFLMMIDPNLVIIPAKIGFALLLGWIPAGARLSSALHEPGAVALWGIGFFFLVAGVQAFANRLGKPWPFRWTVATVGVIWLGIFGGMCLVGMAHQIGWIRAAREPIFKLNERFERSIAASFVASLANKSQWQTTEFRDLLLEARLNTIENYAVIPRGDNGTITNILVVPRNKKVEFMDLHPDGTRTRRPMRELEDALQ